MPSNAPISGRSLDRLLCPVLVGAVLAVFWPVLWGSFLHYEDGVNITENPHLGLSWENLKWMFNDTSYAPRYLPLGWLAYSLNAALLGRSSMGFHLSNLLLHIANTLLLYAILKRLLSALLAGGADRGKPWHPSLPQWGAAAGALWWAVNPLRTEPVAWASSLIYFVATLFFLLSVLFYLRLADSTPAQNRRSRAVWMALLFYCLSLFTYPIALGGLAVFVVMDLLLLRRLPLNPRQWHSPVYLRVWLEKLLFFAPAVLIFSANVYARANHPGSDTAVPLSQFGAAARTLQALWVWSWYLWKPWLPFDLAPKYPDLVTDTPFTLTHLAAAILVAAITVFLLLRRKQWPALLGAWLCYLAILLPHAGLTEHPHYTCDRYSYLVGGMWALLIGAGAILVWQSARLQRPLVVAFILWCSLMGWQAQQQTAIWQDNYKLHIATAESLRNYKERAEHDLAAGIALLEAHHPGEAMPKFRQATALTPEQAEAWEALGDALSEQKCFLQAVASYQKALRLKPELSSARQNLAIALATEGRYQEAVAHLTEVLRQHPRAPLAHYNLACCLNSLGQKEQARQHIAEFYRLQAFSHH